MQAKEKLIEILNSSIEPINKQNNQYNSLLEKIGDARFVLIGEASHGTHEFYQARAEITRQLIQKKGFMAVAIEGDWPDVYKIHRYIQGKGEAKNWQAALSHLKRFPKWMWRNKTLVPFFQWLRQYNDDPSTQTKIGFFGLDLYSLQSSMQAVIQYLEKIDPPAAENARIRYACFDHLKFDPQTYGYLITMGMKKSCMKQALEQILEMQHHALEYIKQDGIEAEDEYFYAMQNARLVKNAENYYRTMFDGHVESWNVRDKHMAETLNLLADHLENKFRTPAKIIIWAHNSHLGDARATEVGERGEINLGELVREQHDEDVYSIGFSTYDGTVTAANDWDKPAERKQINPALTGSCEELFHQLKHKNFLLDLHQKNVEHYLQIPRLQRAIGVIYRPETERESHYYFVRLPYQFDSIIHFDQTSALEPLEINPEWENVTLSGIY